MLRLSAESRANRRLLRLLSCLILISSFSGACAHRASTAQIQRVSATAASLKVVVPSLARESCLPAPMPPPPSPSEADYQVFGLQQTGALEVCDKKRALGVAAADLHNIYVDRLAERLEPPSLWDRLTGHQPPQPPKPSLEELMGEKELNP